MVQYRKRIHPSGTLSLSLWYQVQTFFEDEFGFEKCGIQYDFEKGATVGIIQSSIRRALNLESVVPHSMLSNSLSLIKFNLY